MMNIVVLDGFTVTQNDLSWQALSELPDVSLQVYDRTAPADVVSRCKDAQAILTNKVVISDSIMSQLPQLRYIGVLATGYNVVDVEAARQRNITVTNIPAYSTSSVAQLVFAHLLNVTNQVAHYAQANRDGRWTQNPDFMWCDTPLTELQGKTFVIRGLGNIGTQVAHIALAFGMNVLIVTNRRQKELPAGTQKANWEEALKQADILSLHCPLTEQTRGIINAHALSLMKPTAILINTGRGPLVEEADVAQALSENRLGAYCADVLAQEPPTPLNPLLSAPRCFLTPHIAWATHEARERLLHTAIHNLQAFLAGHPANVIS